MTPYTALVEKLLGRAYPFRHALTCKQPTCQAIRAMLPTYGARNSHRGRLAGAKNARPELPAWRRANTTEAQVGPKTASASPRRPARRSILRFGHGLQFPQALQLGG